MTKLTLHRAGRVQEQIGSRIGRIKFGPHTRLSIFATDPEAEAERRARELGADLERLQRLESIRATVRSVVARQNAETGISTLLCEKASLERQLAKLSKLLDPETPEFEGWIVSGRRRQRHPAPSMKRGELALSKQIAASRLRFEVGEGDVQTDILVPLLDEALEAEIRQRILDRRRRLDDVSDEFRALNSAATIELADDTVAYLQQEGVI
jgi:hypothetical protein